MNREIQYSEANLTEYILGLNKYIQYCLMGIIITGIIILSFALISLAIISINKIMKYIFDVSFEDHPKSKMPHEIVFMLKGNNHTTIDVYRLGIQNTLEYLLQKREKDDIAMWEYAKLLLIKKTEPQILSNIAGLTAIGLVSALETHPVLYHGNIRELCIRGVIEAVKPIYDEDNETFGNGIDDK